MNSTALRRSPRQPGAHLKAVAWHLVEALLDRACDQHDSRALPLVDWWTFAFDARHRNLRASRTQRPTNVADTEAAEYRVIWQIDLFATSPRDAAEQALAVHRDPESIATVFEVCRLGKSAAVPIDLEVADEDGDDAEDEPNTTHLSLVVSARRFSAAMRSGFHYYVTAPSGDDYAGPCNRRDEAEQWLADINAEIRPQDNNADRAAIIAHARRLDDATLDAEACAARPGPYQGADDLALVVALDILSGHGCADEQAGSTESGSHLARFGRYVLETDYQGFMTAQPFTSAELAQAALDHEDAQQDRGSETD